MSDVKDKNQPKNRIFRRLLMLCLFVGLTVTWLDNNLRGEFVDFHENEERRGIRFESYATLQYGWPLPYQEQVCVGRDFSTFGEAKQLNTGQSYDPFLINCIVGLIGLIAAIHAMQRWWLRLEPSRYALLILATVVLVGLTAWMVNSPEVQITARILGSSPLGLVGAATKAADDAIWFLALLFGIGGSFVDGLLILLRMGRNTT